MLSFPPLTLAPFHGQSVNSFKGDIVLSKRASSYRVSHSCPLFFLFFFDNTMMDHLHSDLKATSHGWKHQRPFFCSRTAYILMLVGLWFSTAHAGSSLSPPSLPFSSLPPPGFRRTVTPVSCLIYQASADKCKHLTEEPPHLGSLCGCLHFSFLFFFPSKSHIAGTCLQTSLVLIYFHTSPETGRLQQENRCCYVQSSQTLLC